MPDPRRDTASLAKLKNYLCKPAKAGAAWRGRTIADIRSRFELSERSAYRWLDYLKADGIDVVVRRDGRAITYAVNQPALEE